MSSLQLDCFDCFLRVFVLLLPSLAVHTLLEGHHGLLVSDKVSLSMGTSEVFVELRLHLVLISNLSDFQLHAQWNTHFSI